MYISKPVNVKKRAQRYTVFAFIFLIIFVACVQFFLPNFFQAVFTSMARPFWRLQYGIEIGALNSYETLMSENEALRRELSELKLSSALVQSTENENEELKALLGRTVSFSVGTSSIVASSSIRHANHTLAAVLKRPPFLPYDELIIDGGSDAGFAVGNKVYTAEEVLIGEIGEVLPETAKVLLYSTPGHTEQVLVGGANNLATASGRGGGQYSAELPRAAVVKEGDGVVIPSLSNKPFGIVKAVISDPTQPFVTVLISPPVNVFGSRWVLVDKVRN